MSLTFLSDRRIAAGHLPALARMEFTRIVLAHGDVVERDGPRIFTDAFRDFLTPDRAIRAGGP